MWRDDVDSQECQGEGGATEPFRLLRSFYPHTRCALMLHSPSSPTKKASVPSPAAVLLSSIQP